MGFNATAVQRGTAAMMDQQKKAARDYTDFWQKAIKDKEAAETAADVRQATRNNRARALRRQRAQEDKHASSGMLQEAMVLVREVSRGNFSRVPGSLSILAQRAGILGRIAGAVVNPIAGVAGGLLAGTGINNSIAGYSRNLRANAASAGFSTGGYQTVMMQAGRQSGGAEAAQAAMANLGGTMNSMFSGDPGASAKFRKWGINIGGVTNTEQAWEMVLTKLDQTGNAARKAAMAQDLLGDSYKKFLITINDGAQGFSDARTRMRAFQPTAGELAAQEGSQLTMPSMNSLKGAAAGAHGRFITGRTSFRPGMLGMSAWLWSKIVGGVSGNSSYANAMDQQGAIDDRIRGLNASGRLRRPMDYKTLNTLNPDAAMTLREASMGQSEASSALEDRGKMSVSEMAAQARRMSGHIRPRLYTVTNRMRTAMKIDDLEARSTNAFLSGDDAGFHRLRGEADQMRKSNPWLAYADKNPTAKMEIQLEQANRYLATVQEMAMWILYNR